MTQFLDLDGLKLVRQACDKTYAAKSHTHSTGQITDFGTRVYDAAASRSAHTVLAAPPEGDGTAAFRELTSHYLPRRYNTRGRINQETSWNACTDDGVYLVSSAGAFTGDGAPSDVYSYGLLIVNNTVDGTINQTYISHFGDVLYRQAWSWNNGVPSYSSWHYPVKAISDSTINSMFN